MTEEQLLALVETPEKLKDALENERPKLAIKDILDAYNPEKHKINDRAGKIIETDNGIDTVDVVRLSLPLQKKIVNSSVAFLCGNPIKMDANPGTDQKQADLLSVIDKTLEDNKIFYKNMNLAEILFSQTEVAELWYSEPLKAGDDYWAGTPNSKVKVRLRMKVLANSLGDKLFPSYNEYGDMIAFGRLFETKNGDIKTVHLDVYTATNIYNYTKVDGSDWVAKKGPNPAGKIPIIYYKYPAPDFADVDTLCNRYEESISKHGDTNEYYGSPLVKVTGGEVKGFSKKGEQGKMIEMDSGVTAEYMTWDHSPESVKLEQENLRSLIFDMSDTPDLSFSVMTKVGAESGFAIKLLFMAAHLKAARNEQYFGEGIQRRYNYIKSVMLRLNPTLEPARNLSIKPLFEYYMPKNLSEDIENIIAQVSSGIMSIQTAIEKNPMIADAAEEIKRILKEKKERETDPTGLDNLNNEDGD